MIGSVAAPGYIRLLTAFQRVKHVRIQPRRLSRGTARSIRNDLDRRIVNHLSHRVEKLLDVLVGSHSDIERGLGFRGDHV